MLRQLAISILLISGSLAGMVHVAAAEPVRLILDTDIGNDIDDALALAMIHALESRGEVQLLGVTITKDNLYAPLLVSVINSYYSRPDIPIGIVRDGKTPKDAPMLTVPVERRNPNGQWLYPRQLEKTSPVPDATSLLKQILSGQPDHSVTIAQIGFSTNLRRLMEEPGAINLIRQKVKILYLMAGNFQKPQPEYNVYTDAWSARLLFQSWPTPMVFSGFEIGLEITFPRTPLENMQNNPVADAFRNYVPKQEQAHPNWDSTAVLEAIRPDSGYFGLSVPGNVSLGPNNTTVFRADPNGNARYLELKPDQVSVVRNFIEQMVLEKPKTVSPVALRTVF